MIVLSLGGSIVVPEEIDVGFLKGFRNLLTKYIDQGNKAVIVCGGGKVCRKYINVARNSTTASETEFDRLGVKATELNAELLRVLFEDYAHEVVHSEYNKKIPFSKILFSAGLKPGTSTDYDAVMFANTYKSDTVINLSNIDFVYDKDPRLYKDAKPIKEISWKDFREIIGGDWKAGLNLPFDPMASKEAEKSNMKVIILNGAKLDNLKACLNGKEFIGTVIH